MKQQYFNKVVASIHFIFVQFPIHYFSKSQSTFKLWYTRFISLLLSENVYRAHLRNQKAKPRQFCGTTFSFHGCFKAYRVRLTNFKSQTAFKLCYTRFVSLSLSENLHRARLTDPKQNLISSVVRIVSFPVCFKAFRARLTHLRWVRVCVRVCVWV